MIDYLLVNFGGPRHLDEVEPFLRELLCDRDVVATRFPSWVHNFLFRRVARKRAVSVQRDYELIGGKSPIYFDTESLAESLFPMLERRVMTFHRYIPATHQQALDTIAASPSDEIRVLPLFPQFSYATTGSIARFFSKRLPPSVVQKLRWIKSYPSNNQYVASFQARIRSFLEEHRLVEKETLLLFSAHGLPQSFVSKGDPYQTECELSYRAILSGFPEALGLLSYQSKFGRGEWLRPYTNEICEQIRSQAQGRSNVVFIPLSFTSDHLETLFEIEELYVSAVRDQGLNGYRCPALNLLPVWTQALATLFQTTDLYPNEALIK